MFERKTLSPENEFRFRCPIFPADVKIADCFKLRDMVWRGEGPNVRQGCQCAMNAGKCPVPNILKRMVRDGSDPYHSDAPKVGKLLHEDLEKIGSVLVIDSQMRRYGLSAAEEKHLVLANEAARKHKPISKPRRVERVVMDEVPAAKVETATPDAVVAAAASGDLSAAITAASEEGK
jgi:hypothetical protein